MIKVGIAQIKNSTDIASNYQTIMGCLSVFKKMDVDLVLFPECSLSGFSAKIKDCTLDIINPYLDEINTWSKVNDVAIVLPTALKNEKIFNTGFFFKSGVIDQFYKIGLTESEKNFFSIPSNYKKKVYEVNGHRFMPLICMEAQLDPHLFLEKGSLDFILWPAYWGWEHEDEWGPLKRDGELNLVYANVTEWSTPILQSNFSFNDIGDDRNNGPHGLSVVIDKNNQLIYRAGFEKEECFVVELDRCNDVCRIK